MIPPLLKDLHTDLRKFFNLESDTLWRGKDVVIFVGQNGAGKSMVRRMLKVGAQERNIAIYDFSQERRCSGDLGTAMIYGDETWQSTGFISLSTLQRAFKQKPGKDFLLVWDEPEIGLSEESLLGMVEALKEQLENPPKRLLGCIFMTHSRLFVRELQDYPGLAFVDLDGQYKTAKEWSNRKVKAADIQETLDYGFARFRTLTKMLKK